MDLMLLLVWGPWVQTGESWALVRHAVDSLPHFGHGTVQLHPVISQGPWELVRALCGLWSWTLYKAGVEWLNFHLSAVQNLYTNFSPNADSYLPIPLPTMALCTSLMNRQPCSFLFVNSKRDVDFHCSGSTGRSVHEVLMLFLAAGETNHSLSQLMSLFVAMTIFKTCTAWDQEQKTSHLQLKPQDCYVNTLSQIQYSAIQDGKNIPRVPSLCRFTSKNLGPRKG